MLIGYVRALPDLSAPSQYAVLEHLDCQKIFEEGQAGFAERNRMLDRLWEGDVVLVVRLACLANSLAGLLEVGQRLFDREAGLISRAEPWADTTKTAGAAVLGVLSGLALIGLPGDGAPSPPLRASRPVAEDSKVGRPVKVTARQWEQYGAQVLSGELSVSAAAKLMGCGRATLYRHLAGVKAAGG